MHDLPTNPSDRCHSLSFNGALFYTEVDDMQFFNFFAGPFGLLQPIADLIKMMTKEDLIPRGADRAIFRFAPAKDRI